MSSCLKSTGAIINIGRGPGERTTVWVDVELEQLPNLVKIGQLRDAQITIKNALSFPKCEDGVS